MAYGDTFAPVTALPSLLLRNKISLAISKMRSEILWAARYGSLFVTHQSTKQLNFLADGCIWMSDFALAKVSVFSNLPIVFSEMVLCFIFPTSRDLHANTFRELSEVYADLIRHAGFHFPTTGNFTLWNVRNWQHRTYDIWFWLENALCFYKSIAMHSKYLKKALLCITKFEKSLAYHQTF